MLIFTVTIYRIIVSLSQTLSLEFSLAGALDKTLILAVNEVFEDSLINSCLSDKLSVIPDKFPFLAQITSLARISMDVNGCCSFQYRIYSCLVV